jgi:hypothetical protein
VTELTVDVHHLEVDHFDVVFLNQIQDILYTFRHLFFSILEITADLPPIFIR